MLPLILTGLLATAPAAEPPAVPRHVVFVIADGMGLTQISAARARKGTPMFWETAEAVGLQSTWSTELVTDSAAGATAMACGIKTDNGRIGQAPDGTPCTTLMEEAITAGRGTGVVVTSRVTHATPASFLAHHPSRRDEPAIARQVLGVPVDVLIGGGRDMFPADKHALAIWRERKVTVFDGTANILAHDKTPLIGFTFEGSPPPAAQRGPTAPLALHALNLIDDDPQGAFLLVEASQVDWGGHANQAAWVMDEIDDLDDLLRAVVKAGGDDTLVVLTADHETGGLSLLGGSRTGGPVQTQFATDHHSAAYVPVYAWGPGAAAFTGVYDNTDLHAKLRAALGLGLGLGAR